MFPAPNTSSKRRWFRPVLRVPYLAAVISVGFHGVLFASGPTFPELTFDVVEDQIASQNARQVPLVELTAAEQQRLPDFSRSLYNLDNLGGLEELESLLGEDLTIQESPSTGSAANNHRGTSSTSNTPDYRTSIIGPLTVALSGTNYRPENNRPTPTQSSTTIDATPTTGETADSDDLPPLPSNVETVNPPSLEPPPIPGAEADTTNLEGNSPSAVPTDADALADSSGSTEQPLSPTVDDDDLLASISEEDFLQEALALAAEWETEIPEEPTSLIVNVVEPLLIKYTGRTCLPEAPLDGAIGALITPDGVLAEDMPRILQTTGYRVFDREALQRIVDDLDFYAYAGELTAWRFAVQVEHNPDDCIPIGQSNTTPNNLEGRRFLQSPDKAPDPTATPAQPSEEASDSATASDDESSAEQVNEDDT